MTTARPTPPEGERVDLREVVRMFRGLVEDPLTFATDPDGDCFFCGEPCEPVAEHDADSDCRVFLMRKAWGELQSAAVLAALAQPTPPATGTVGRECVCSVRADDCGLPCPCWHHTPPATGTVERCGWCGGSGRITSGSAVCPTCHGTGKSAPTPAPEPSAALVEAHRMEASDPQGPDPEMCVVCGQGWGAHVWSAPLAAARAEGLDGLVNRMSELDSALHKRTKKVAISGEDWRYSAGYSAAVRDLRAIAAAYREADR